MRFGPRVANEKNHCTGSMFCGVAESSDYRCFVDVSTVSGANADVVDSRIGISGPRIAERPVGAPKARRSPIAAATTAAATAAAAAAAAAEAAAAAASTANA